MLIFFFIVIVIVLLIVNIEEFLLFDFSFFIFKLIFLVKNNRFFVFFIKL